MKFNKVIMCLGVMSLMLTSCDKANEQNYDPAAGVATPPAYFSIDYDEDIVLEELMESFTIPVFRSEAGAATTANATVTMTTSAHVDGLFTLPGNKTINPGQTVNTTFSFAEGATQGEMVVTYPWSEMEQLPGVEFYFDVKVDGEDTPYFLTHTTYTAMYVPWQNPTDEAGNSTCYFLDNLITTGWKLSGSWEGPWKYEVEIQYNPVALEKGQLIYRCLTPYANVPDWGQAGYAVFEGYDADGNIISNPMYINATDENNVYLCDKKGNPLTEAYNTMYYFHPNDGISIYYDRCAYYTADQPLYILGGNKNLNSDGDISINGYLDEDGTKIIFPQKHFIVEWLTAGEAGYGNDLEIWLPGAKEKAEWEEIGFCQYTDDVASFLEIGESQTYEVPVWQNIEDPNLIKVMNPYTEYWPDGNDMDDEYSLIFDVTNKDCVILELAETGLQLPYGRNYYENLILNAANYWINYAGDDKLTASQVIANGDNDTYDEATGLIDCKHVLIDYIISDDQEKLVALWENGSTGIQVQLPDASGARGYCTAKMAKVKSDKKCTARRLSKFFYAIR